MRRKVMMYHKSPESDTLLAFLSLSETMTFARIDDHFIEIENDFYEEEFDLSHIRELALQEIYQDLTLLILPLSGLFDSRIAIDFLPKMNFDIYTPESFITEVCITHLEAAKQRLKNYYYNHFGHETMETVLGFIDHDLNATKAAKALFMHRNTLNYRLDHFIEKSEINIRHFNGAFAIKLLFS